MQPRRTPRRSRAATAAETRERLLETAGHVFRRDGYHGASLERIASEAGYTKGAVYSAFDAKASLFLELLSRRASDRRAEIDAILAAAANSRDFVREVSQRFARQVASERDWWAAVIEFAAVVGRDEALRRRYASHHDATREQIAAAIEEWARREGRRLSIPARRAATMVLAVSNGLTIESLVAPREVTLSSYADAQSALLLGLFGPADDGTAR